MIFGSPPIVTSGLVLNLDAANTKSYPRSGTVWRDLSGNNNSGNLVNGPTYNSQNGGSIVFDGVDDFVSGSIINSTLLTTNGTTVEAWVKHNALSNTVQRYVSTFPTGTEQAVIRFDGPVGPNTLRFYIVTTTGYKFLNSSNQIFINNWYHVVGTWNGTTQSLYKNGNLLVAANQTGTLVTGSVIDYYVSLLSESLNGFMPVARIYNRALTPTEVQQNYNAQKSRFNLQ